MDYNKLVKDNIRQAWCTKAIGEADKAGAKLQVVSGVVYKTWFTGIGAGIDYYSGFKSIPVFIEVKKDLHKKRILLS